VVIKTTEEDKLIADLSETFANLREFQWKLKPPHHFLPLCFSTPILS
jgi:hypothetical protein